MLKDLIYYVYLYIFINYYHLDHIFNRNDKGKDDLEVRSHLTTGTVGKVASFISENLE